MHACLSNKLDSNIHKAWTKAPWKLANQRKYYLQHPLKPYVVDWNFQKSKLWEMQALIIIDCCFFDRNNPMLKYSMHLTVCKFMSTLWALSCVLYINLGLVKPVFPYWCLKEVCIVEQKTRLLWYTQETWWFLTPSKCQWNHLVRTVLCAKNPIIRIIEKVSSNIDVIFSFGAVFTEYPLCSEEYCQENHVSLAWSGNYRTGKEIDKNAMMGEVILEKSSIKGKW